MTDPDERALSGIRCRARAGSFPTAVSMKGPVVHTSERPCVSHAVRPGRRRRRGSPSHGRRAAMRPLGAPHPNARPTPSIDRCRTNTTSPRDRQEPRNSTPRPVPSFYAAGVVIDVRPRETPRQRTDPALAHRHHRAPHRRASSLCARSRTHAPSGSWVTPSPSGWLNGWPSTQSTTPSAGAVRPRR